ncbi:hypothetical protein CDL15_Pgr024922 [Punica granatum]|uniref:Uncharacterized protein n=1 Tax=Punica granatum TaxID=22663 RepID=A0A218W7G7_PUNGR|nr:hypothetical protein CDL15_Pgr024922 [Punica granatum]PKI49884.1 hypothetical protein CRG98_029722 [Punica granatum]
MVGLAAAMSSTLPLAAVMKTSCLPFLPHRQLASNVVGGGGVLLLVKSEASTPPTLPLRRGACVDGLFSPLWEAVTSSLPSLAIRVAVWGAGLASLLVGALASPLLPATGTFDFSPSRLSWWWVLICASPASPPAAASSVRHAKECSLFQIKALVMPPDCSKPTFCVGYGQLGPDRSASLIVFG